jgi:DNA-binding NtrC family response regulator
LLGKIDGNYEGMSERDIFYKVLVDLRRDVNDLKKVVFGLLENNEPITNTTPNYNPTPTYSQDSSTPNRLQLPNETSRVHEYETTSFNSNNDEDDEDFIEAETYSSDTDSTLSLEAKEIEMIRLALTKNHGKRKKAADDLGISERTLYRKIKQYDLE